MVRSIRIYRHISIQNKKLHDFTFKEIPLNSNRIQNLSLPRFYALQEGFSSDDSPVCQYGPYNGLRVLKTGPLDDPLNLAKRNKSSRGRIDK